eukprot:TRINITY_DN3289_c0_g1_i10.p1 TRINITY_DN3289_c0_g1~~TRINITY_DN3289_c0_g1_i10.p1  ORF type:complete len:181 (-),score=41.58 TRINITY_DN3289_c0_g1_i10:320-862(-)
MHLGSSGETGLGSPDYLSCCSTLSAKKRTLICSSMALGAPKQLLDRIAHLMQNHPEPTNESSCSAGEIQAAVELLQPRKRKRRKMEKEEDEAIVTMARSSELVRLVLESGDDLSPDSKECLLEALCLIKRDTDGLNLQNLEERALSPQSQEELEATRDSTGAVRPRHSGGSRCTESSLVE